MTARPWGTTGRVTLERDDDAIDTAEVIVDGEWRGWVGYPTGDGDPNWWGTAYGKGPAETVANYTLPSLDAAVMWVLRRAAADVWRQERGPIRRVARYRLSSLVGPTPFWIVTDPSHERGDEYAFRSWSLAVETARRSAKAEVPVP